MASFISNTFADFAHASTDQDVQSSGSEKTQPTAAEQIEQMQASGQSVNEIAAALGMPVSLVDSDLGIVTQPTDTALTTISIKV